MGVLRLLVLVGLIAGVVAAGCSRKDETARTQESSSPRTSASLPTTGSATTAGGSSAQILVELRQHEIELAQIVEQGRLTEVHGKVAVIGKLLAKAPDRATDLSDASRAQLRKRAAASAKMADALHDAGDTGDLSASKIHFGHYQAELREIENILSAGSLVR